MPKPIFIILIVVVCSCKNTNTDPTGYPSLEKFNDGIHHWNLFHDHSYYSRYSPDQYIDIANNLIAFQNTDGGWPKNIDWLAIIDIDSLKSTFSEKDARTTLDNNNVFPQIEYLSKVYWLSDKAKYEESTLKGLRYLLQMQKPSGGWRGWDVDAITYNDQVMTGVMNLFLDISNQPEHFKWIDKELLDSIELALNKAIDITLSCQIEVNGVKTAWCQQHDHKTLKPVKARSYELASITGRESVDVIEFLMRIENPSKEVKQAVMAATNWLQSVKIEGIRLEKIPLNKDEIINDQYPYDLKVIYDSTAKPIWARYYDLKNSKPFLCRRDGNVIYSLDSISAERRTGYAWYGYWPQPLLGSLYPEWLAKNNISLSN